MARRKGHYTVKETQDTVERNFYFHYITVKGGQGCGKLCRMSGSRENQGKKRIVGFTMKKTSHSEPTILIT